MQYEDRREKRLSRFLALKDGLLDELVDFKISQQNSEKSKEAADPDYVVHNDPDSEEDLEMFVRQWEKDFDRSNQNPEDNSDFDSDNDINPLDSINQHGEYTSKQQQISSENKMKSKPIQLSILGKPNIGKSTLVNSLLKEHRVVANDMPGTTRDSISVQWAYEGRRVVLVDTAGIKPGSGLPKTEVDMKVNEQVDEVINYSHVVCVMIDSLSAFTAADM